MTTSRAATDPVLVVVSLDVEEDNWCPARHGIGVSNVRALPAWHRLLVRAGVRPTYFTSYQVAHVPWASDVLRELASERDCEIGAHLHPWNTPPIEEAFLPRNTMMKNLAEALQRRKVDRLTTRIEEAIGIRPTSFRAGRYGIGPSGASILAHSGYLVDSSVTPFIDWRPYDDGADFDDAPTTAYVASADDIRVPSPDGPLIELPLSIGFTRRPFARWHVRHERLRRARVGPLSLASLAYRTRLLRKVQLSPETDDARDMLDLTAQLLHEGARFLHVTWHSPTMRPGLSPFVRDAAALRRFLERVETYLDGLAALTPVRFATVSEAAGTLLPSLPAEAADARLA